jgi:hypothetical protein
LLFLAVSGSSESVVASMMQKAVQRSRTTDGERTGGLGEHPKQFLSLQIDDLKPLD